MALQKLCRIFVTEDVLMYRKMLAYLLKSDEEIDLHIFENGQACLDHLHLEPDLIILDYTLPDWTGEEMLLKIKSIHKEQMVIILSGLNDPELIKDLFEIGAYDYIVKDKLTRIRLLKAVQQLKTVLRLKLSILEYKS